MHERKYRIGWVLYDFANSSYHLMIPTILLPLYFRQFWGSGLKSPDLVWAVVVSVPVVAAGLCAPFLGALADRTGGRVTWLRLTAFFAIVTIAVTAIVPEGAVWTGGVSFGLSYFFFVLSLGLYDALLPFLVVKERGGVLSGLGWGLGYLGGIVAVAISFPLLKGASLPDDASAFRWSIWLVAALYLLLSIMSFALLGNVGEQMTTRADVPAESGSLRESFHEVLQTLKHWRDHREALKVIISYYLANDGLATLVYFTSIYASVTLGFTSQQILGLFLIVQLVAVPSSILGGYLADRLGHVPTILVTLVVWVALSVGYGAAYSISAFYVISIGTGLVIGTTPALYRSLLVAHIQRNRAAQMFGFNSFASRGSSVLGPILFGAVATFTASQRIAMFMLVVFFVAAAVMLLAVRRVSSIPDAQIPAEVAG